jgi:WD40 repeat protein
VLKGKPVAVTGARNGTVQIWDLTTRQPIGYAMVSNAAVSALALGELKGKPVAVTGGQNGTVQIWDLTTRQPIGDPIASQDGRVTAAAVGQLKGKPIAVTGDRNGTVRIWNLTTRQPIGNPMIGSAAVSALALGELTGKPIAVTGDRNGTVRIWNLTTRQPIGSPVTGNEGSVSTIAIGSLSPAHFGGTDRRITGPLARLTASTSAPAIRSLAVTQIGSRWIGVLGTGDGRASTVDLAAGAPLHKMDGDGGSAVTAIACEQIAGRPVAILASALGEKRVLDLLSGETAGVGHIEDRLLDTGPVSASALIVTQGSLMRVLGETNGTISVEHGKSTDLLPRQHDGAVTAVACTYLNDRPVAFTGGWDGIVRIWDLTDRRLLDIIAVLGPVFTIWATSHGELLIGASGEVIAFQHASLPVPSPGDPR